MAFSLAKVHAIPIVLSGSWTRPMVTRFLTPFPSSSGAAKPSLCGQAAWLVGSSALEGDEHLLCTNSFILLNARSAVRKQGYLYVCV